MKVPSAVATPPTDHMPGAGDGQDAPLPTVSVIIPVYNAGRFLEPTLDALFEQSVEDIELIAIDDGSTDASAATLDAYAARFPSKLRVLHTPNRGAWQARLEGVAQARAPWIGFCDANDLPKPQLYGQMLARAQSEQADLVVCAFERFDDTSGRSLSVEMTQFGTETRSVAEDPGFLLALNTANWNKLYRAELLTGALSFGALLAATLPAPPRVAEDMLLQLLAVLSCDRVSFLDEPLYRYRVMAGSAMSKTSAEDISGLADALCLVRAGSQGDARAEALIDLMALTHLGLSFPLRLASLSAPPFGRTIVELQTLLDAKFPGYLCKDYTSAAYVRSHGGMNKRLGQAQEVYRLRLAPLVLRLLRFAARHHAGVIRW